MTRDVVTFDRTTILATKPREMVDHPDHYQGKTLEAIDIIEDYDLNFNLGSALKYILRAGKKNETEQDLQKAIWFIKREAERIKKTT